MKRVAFQFTCWARLPGDQLQRVDVVAADHEAAVAAGFRTMPRAVSMSCRPSGAAEERRYD